METENLISDETWNKILSAAEALQSAESQTDRQKAIKTIRRVMIEELDVDFGTPW